MKILRTSSFLLFSFWSFVQGQDDSPLRRASNRFSPTSRNLQGFPVEDSASLDEAGKPDFWTSEEGGVFTPAQPLEFFRNGIDKSVFEWINRDEVQAGGTTCGFLYPELGSDPFMEFPKIRVYMCMKFATVQPAPKGNVVVHCGGPDSLTNCIGVMGGAGYLGESNVANYNVISIDQRGMGRSWPTMVHEACSPASVPLDPSNETSIREYLQMKKQQVKNCWTCEDCDFHFNATRKSDGTVVPVHFLEYAGTHQLAEDLFLFREAIKAPKLSVYGGSYGTTVMSTYATLFPNYVDKFVIDSPVTPSNQLIDFARGYAYGRDFRFNYIAYSCWAVQTVDPEACPVEDMAKCIRDLEPYADAFEENFKNLLPYNVMSAEPWEYIFQVLALDPAGAGEICDAAGRQDDDEVINLAYAIFDQLNATRTRNMDIDCDTYSAPSEDSGPCLPTDYADLAGNILTDFVNGMDFAGGIESYNEDIFIQEVMAFDEKYNGSGSHMPGSIFAQQLSSNYYWPKNIPLPVRGNPSITGIVSGQLYDAMTPYVWASEMRGAFKFTNMLTSQSIQHGLANAQDAGDCQKHIQAYFETGQVGFVDGTVCGADYPYFSANISP